MTTNIGIRHEDKYAGERRTPLTPAHVAKLIRHENLSFTVEQSPKRIFSDQEYQEAGAGLAADLKACPIILGVKEIPVTSLEADKTYVYFSHVIKGQPYNMPMLKRLMELRCNLIDYERIIDDQNKRLIFFGRFAGLAGMINALWSLGQRLQALGHAENPFLNIQQAYRYPSLEAAKKAISAVGQEIAEKGLPASLLPMTIGFTGYGNVSQGAQEIAALLPMQEISPETLLMLQNRQQVASNIIYKIVFKEQHISRPKESNTPFDLQDYYQNPQKYQNDFEQYIPHLTILMNCMYWDSRYPRIFTKDYAEQLFGEAEPKIKVVGDVTCDPNGSIEFTHQGTSIDDPVFVYNPLSRKPEMGFRGPGLLVMAVDILPSELPRDSSMAFADALAGFLPAIAKADFKQALEQLALPRAIKKALILHKGKLTPDYQHLAQYL